MGIWLRTPRRLLLGGVLAAGASSCVGSCNDDGPCTEAFTTGDRLEVTLVKLASGADGATCLTNVGMEPGTKIVMSVAETTQTRLKCTSFLVDLEIPDYALTRSPSRNEDRMVGGDFDAVYKGTCKGFLNFDLVYSELNALPVRADSGVASPVLGAFGLEFAAEAGCPGASCTATFYVDIDRAGPRDGGEGDQ